MFNITDKVTLEEIKILTQELNCQSGKYYNWPNVSLNRVAEVTFNELTKSPTKLIVKIADKVLLAIAIEKLEWDTIYFGFNCAKISYFNISTNYKKDIYEELYKIVSKFIDGFATDNEIRFISADLDSWHTTTSHFLQNNGFKYILTWLDGFIASENLPKSIILPLGHSFGELAQNDIAYFKNISNNQYFSGGRFYLDGGFTQESVKGLYSKIIEHSFTNNDINIVYKIDDKPVGIFICKKIIEYASFSNLKVAPLRFLLVDNNYRDLKIGRHLFNATLFYLKEKTDIITTGLEIHNIKSLNLHSYLHFNFNYTHNVFHKWYYSNSLITNI